MHCDRASRATRISSPGASARSVHCAGGVHTKAAHERCEAAQRAQQLRHHACSDERVGERGGAAAEHLAQPPEQHVTEKVLPAAAVGVVSKEEADGHVQRARTREVGMQRRRARGYVRHQ